MARFKIFARVCARSKLGKSEALTPWFRTESTSRWARDAAHTKPTEKTSTLASGVRVGSRCSGAIHRGEPAEDRMRCPLNPCRPPKSIKWGWCCSSIRMLEGLRSKCNTPRSWAWVKASVSWIQQGTPLWPGGNPSSNAGRFDQLHTDPWHLLSVDGVGAGGNHFGDPGMVQLVSVSLPGETGRSECSRNGGCR